MTQYMLSVHHDGTEDFSSIDEATMQKMFADVDAFNTELQASGSWVFAGGLQPIEASTTVDATGAEPILTDGPFSESKEFLGGFWIIDVADLDAALDWARRGSAACQGKVEVRPFQEEPS
ncbi:hypothetical protein ASD11_02740 [Aeromicrobium sp. Root495]|uniref:YciI family protein n=1 Tax=Aeromicrobium sp. Root495 TaxID=1736550 RepID=UPI0006FB1E5D|nr:YciI family protein [Aeromicrobium sp. Root495]KQY60602.1 hypothetical protein ASD11_02740 [Aeromicrobium sp. Root495]RYJ06665.1 MAG: hypothetical protein EON52_05195 [Actinomycetales bacterium]